MGTIDATARLKDQSVGDPQAIKSSAEPPSSPRTGMVLHVPLLFIGKLGKST